MELVTFDPVKIGAIITAVMIATQFLKKALEWIEEVSDNDSWVGRLAARLAHGRGAKIISALSSAIAIILVYGPQVGEIVTDGALTIDEAVLVLGWFGITAGANLAYLVVRGLAFTKE